MFIFLFLEKKISYLFPIQSETYDYIYDGEDLIAQASKLLLSLSCISAIFFL